MAKSGSTESSKDSTGQISVPSKISTATFGDGGSGAVQVGNDADPNPHGARK